MLLNIVRTQRRVATPKTTCCKNVWGEYRGIIKVSEEVMARRWMGTWKAATENTAACARVTPLGRVHLIVGVNDTPVFLLNEYIVELNPAKFLKLNNFLNWISFNWIMFWIEFCPKFSYWIFYWIEFCPKISYWIFYWTESGLKTENQLYFESILWYYTLKYPKNTPKCLIMP